MDPVNSNTLDKSCTNPMGSNCVTYQGPDLPCVSVCKGSSITEVIYSIGKLACGGATNTASPCYTGNWIDFSIGIPTSGAGVGTTWTILNYGTGGENNPMYKWTKEGDLSMRGSLEFKFTPTVTGQLISIPLVALPTTCFPPNWNASQSVLVTVECFGVDFLTTFFKASAFIEYPTGILKLNCAFEDLKLNNCDFTISFGGVRFNLS